MSKSDKIQILAVVIIVLFFLAVVVCYMRGEYFGLGHPYDLFLFGNSVKPFGDFIDMIPLVKDLNPYLINSEWGHSLPLGFLFFYPFTFLKNPYPVYILLASIFTSIFAFLNYKFFRCSNLSKIQNFQNIFVLTFMSYPFLTLIDRGNIDMLCFLILMAFVLLFKKEKYLLSAVLLALVSAIKPIFIIFTVLFLSVKKFKEFFLTCCSFFVLTLLGFKLLKGGYVEQLTGLMQAHSRIVSLLVYSNYGEIFNSGLLSMLKVVFIKLIPIIAPAKLMEIYKIMGIILSSIILLFTCLQKQFWKQVLLLVIFLILMPYLSLDYKLFFLFMPLYLFVNEERISPSFPIPFFKGTITFDFIYCILFALLLIPKSFFLLGNPVSNEGIIVNPILMLIFLTLIIYETILEKNKCKNLN